MVASAKKLAETFRISIFTYAECGLKEKSDPVLLSQIFKRLSSLGCIHQPLFGASPH
ncbi:hypothetical protein Oscil6304_0458 [Oscillatoria acuminata PCC 6304]|uniref:Uncharacterized protein n=1 Tax=Oscillatoria acuminata PCC 6304 TaxID=56110 RepID=K9TCE2_9CYAN|nr:hypothetical protein Oscil6304_0458 [Oscillatoria acuminata PCC 6304]